MFTQSGAFYGSKAIEIVFSFIFEVSGILCVWGKFSAASAACQTAVKAGGDLKILLWVQLLNEACLAAYVLVAYVANHYLSFSYSNATNMLFPPKIHTSLNPQKTLAS